MTDARRRPRAAACMLIAAALAGLSSTGCAMVGGDRGAITLTSESTGEVLGGGFTEAIYGYDGEQTIHVLLVAEEGGEVARAVHLRMMWRPRPGRTPLKAESTNCTVRYLVFTGEGAGMYSGAGLLLPSDPSGRRFSGSLREATVRLMDASDGFEDTLGPAMAGGRFTATRDDAGVLRRLREIQADLRDRLTYPAMLGATPAASPSDAG